jgi:putative MATE family efflux protein
MMRDMPMKKLLLHISLPLMISLLVQSLYNIVDSIFVSRLSETALSATSLASPIQMLMIAVSVGTGIGVNSLLARTIGSGDREKAGKVATTGLTLAILSCLVFVLFGAFLTVPFLRLFTEDAELLALSNTYLQIVTMFSLGIFVATTAERLLQASGNTQLSMWAQVSGAVANCILDPIMIFGYFGVPAMGIAGAAIATVIGQWLAAGVALILNWKLNSAAKINYHGFRMEKVIVLQIYKVGAPSMLVSGLASIQTIIINKILIDYSATAVAFFGVFYKMQSLVMLPINGLSQGLIPIVGYSYGAKNGSRISEALRLTLKYVISIAAVFLVLFMLFPTQILGLFSAGEDMLAIGIPGIRILCLIFVLQGFSFVVGYTFTSMGNGLVNMITTMIRIGVSVLLVIVISHTMSDLGMVWWAMPIADVAAASYSMVSIRKARRTIIQPLMSSDSSGRR